MFCRFVKPDAEQGVCQRCGRVLKSIYPPEQMRAQCRAWPLWHEFGEWSSLAVSLTGITPSRWGWVRWKLGLQEPGACGGCEARKVWLNSLGGRLASSEHWAAKIMARLLVRRVRR